MVRRCINLPLEPAHAAALQRDSRATPAGYTVLTFGNHWPDEYLDDRCELGHRMSTDIPMGEQELDEQAWDAGHVHALEASLGHAEPGQGHDGGTPRCLRPSPLASLEVAIPLGAPESAWQHDTLVIRERVGTDSVSP